MNFVALDKNFQFKSVLCLGGLFCEFTGFSGYVYCSTPVIGY